MTTPLFYTYEAEMFCPEHARQLFRLNDSEVGALFSWDCDGNEYCAECTAEDVDSRFEREEQYVEDVTSVNDAQERVYNTPQLEQYADIILDDNFMADEAHVTWVNTADVASIFSWAEDIYTANLSA